jgi:CRISPR type IV-associated protein Csf3
MNTNLQITATLQCAVLTDGALPLDGILLYYAMREQYGYAVFSDAGAVTVPLVPLPFARRGREPEWYYACSSAQWKTPIVEGVDYWTKRGDWSKYAELIAWGNKKDVEIKKGRYRPYHMPIAYRHAIDITWYCEGDCTAITSLLQHVTHIGKKTAQGWGAVKTWRVVPVGVDYSTWREDVLLRPVPISAWPRERPHTEMQWQCAGYRPPYWLSTNQTLCVVP